MPQKLSHEQNNQINIRTKPSYYAHLLSGVVFLCAIILLLVNIQNIKSDPKALVQILVLLASSLSIHSLSHLGLEVSYGYNPIQNILDWLKRT
jgi:hypothetical protein